MADLKSRIGGKRKYFSNLVWKREDQLGHSGHPKRAASLTYHSRREENTPADYDSDASSIASSDCGEEAYFLASNGEGRGEGPTAPYRRFRSAEPTSLLNRLELPVFSASSPIKRANAVESPKRLIERIGSGLYAAQHTPIMLHSEDMDIDITPASEVTIAEEAPNGHVWPDQAIHEAGEVSGINSMAIDTVHHEAGTGTIESAPTISDSLNNRVEESNGDHRQPAGEDSTAHKDVETIPGLTFSERRNHLNSPVQHQNADASSSSSSPAFPIPVTEGGSLEQTLNSCMTPQALPIKKSPASSLEEGQWEETSSPPKVPPDFILNVRKLLLPLVAQNAQHRTDFGQETIRSPESVQKALSGVVDDEVCTSFAGQMSVIRKEMVALNATAVKEAVMRVHADRSQVAQEESGSMSSQPLPLEKRDRTAPRAMREVSSQSKKIELSRSPNYGDNSKEGQSKTEAPTAIGPEYREQSIPKDKADESSKYIQLREIHDRRAGYEAKRSSAKGYTPRQDSLNGRVETRRTMDRDYARSHYRRDSSDMQVDARPRRSPIPDRHSDSLENPPAPVRTPTKLAFKDWGNRTRKGSVDTRRPSLWHDSNLSSDGIDRTKRLHVAPDRRTSHSSTSATRRSPSRSPPHRHSGSRSPTYSHTHARQDKVHSPSRRQYSPAPPSTSRSAEFSSRRARSSARNGRSPSPAENRRVRRGRSRSRSPISRHQKEVSPTRKDPYTSRRRSPYYSTHHFPEAPRRSARKPYSPIRRSQSPPMRRRTPTYERLDKTPRKSRSPTRRRYESPHPPMEIDSRSPSPSRPGKRHRLPEARPASTINGPQLSSARSSFEKLNEERKTKINHLNETSATHPPSNPVLLKSCHNVPGLWFVKMGSKYTNILECSFEVDKETAAKWDIPEISPGERTAPSRMGKPRLSLQILCLPTDLVQSVQATIQPGASAEDVAIALSTIEGRWPPIGNLIIEVNPGTSHGHTWLPFDLQPTSPSVNLEDHIHEGRNVVRLIQLAGMADRIFVLYASLQQPPPPTKFPHDLNKIFAETKFKLGDVGIIPPLVTSVSVVTLDSDNPNA